MKLPFCALLTFALAAASAHADAQQIKGINYDPVHSIDFAVAVGTDNLAGMTAAIELDLDKIKALHAAGYPDIRVLKTFFSSYRSLGFNGAPVVLQIADVVDGWNRKNPQDALQLALGVYEFEQEKDGCQGEAACKEWTAAQVLAAMQSANKHPKLIRRIVVGNENLENRDTRSQRMAKRMVEDINRIRGGVIDPDIRIGTAQTAMGGREVAEGIYPGLKETLDFIGVNVYPFWSGTSYPSAKAEMDEYWRTFPAVSIEKVETEEGWPSGGGDNGNALSSPDSLVDYFKYWYSRTGGSVPVESYYFALFDKTPGQGVESHWGLFSADRNSGILGDYKDWSKPLAPQNVLVKFDNSANGFKTAVSACMGDWNGTDQGKCFPVDGYFGTGLVPGVERKTMMVQTDGSQYKSLLITYSKGINPYLRLCYIDQASLRQLHDGSAVNLKWVNDQGDAHCDVN